MGEMARRSGPLGLLVAMALSLAVRAGAAVPEVGTLRLYETPAYSLVVADGVDARGIARQIANFERVLSRTLARDVRPTGTATHVYVVSGAAWERYLRPGRGIDAEFVPRRFSNLLLIDGDLSRRQRREAVFHEYTHLFLHTQFRGLHPLWFDEGLATMLGATKLHGRRAIIALPALTFRGRWIPLSRLFELDKTSPEYLSVTESAEVHLESWGIVHRGLIDDPAFGASMLKFLAALNRFVPIEEAAQDSFGMSLAALDTSMQRYLAEASFRGGVIEFEPAQTPSLGKGRRLTELESRTRLARVMLDTGLNPQNAHELISSAAALAPDSPDVAVLELRLALREHDESRATALLEKLPTGDARVAREAALALVERVDEPGHAERAYAWLDRALQADDSDAEAAWGFALAAAHLKRGLGTALERLELARARVPDNADLAMATALVHEAAGSPENMLPWLIETWRYSGDAAQRIRAAQKFRELRALQRQTAPQ
jgi:tetratricopeptide (TPR) repeat protein